MQPIGSSVAAPRSGGTKFEKNCATPSALAFATARSSTQMRKATTHMPLIVVGSLLLAAGVVYNQYSLAIFTFDGEIGSKKNLAVIWAFQLISIVVGVCIIVFREHISLNSVIVKIFYWLVFSVFGIVACSVVLFGVFEVFPELVPKALERNHRYYVLKSRFVFDAELGYRMKPHYQVEMTYFGDMYSPTMEFKPEPIKFHILHDENGHHNLEVPSDPDVAMIGDSWLWIGHDWADTFAARLEETSGYVTYNLGVSGYGPQQYLIAFNRYAAGLLKKMRELGVLHAHSPS